MRKAKQILGSYSQHWMPKPSREIDTRWGANARSCQNIIEGCYIRNEDGENFWVLLFKELSTYYNDWRVGRLEALVTMCMMPEMHINCALEYEAGLFFEAQHAWHAMPGELTCRPGLRTMELPTVRRCRDSSRVAIRRTRRSSEHPPPSKVPRMSTGDSVPAGTKAGGGIHDTQSGIAPGCRAGPLPPRDQASATRAARPSIRRLSREGQPYLPPQSMGSIRLIIKEKNKVSEGGAGRRGGGGGHRRWRCRVSSPSRFVVISVGCNSSREDKHTFPIDRWDRCAVRRAFQ